MSNRVPEFWTDIPGSTRYQISNYGNFRRKLKNGKLRPIKPYIRKGKWLVVKVEYHGKYAEYIIHQIVAAVFLEPGLEGQNLWHKNGVIKDNYAGNLEWVDKPALGKRTGGKTRKCIPVVQLDRKSGEIINFYRSIREAAKDNYISAESICEVIRGNQKTAAGYMWRKECWEDFA